MVSIIQLKLEYEFLNGIRHASPCPNRRRKVATELYKMVPSH